jgi:two-component system, NtrC family, sensor kinase
MNEPLAKQGRGTARWPLALGMIAAIGAVTALAWWDERREAKASLQDLASEQATVASAVAATVQAHLQARSDPRGTRATDLLRMLAGIRDLTVFVAPASFDTFLALDGSRVASPPLRAALDGKAGSVCLSPFDAAALGLPDRTAVAGLASLDAGLAGRWDLATVATAARERDREKRAQARLLLGVMVASGLVLVFGTAALRRQRHELELARDLAIAEAQREGEEKLARAQRLATMGTFAAGIAHEVATPLGVIVGRAEQLMNRGRNDDERTSRSLQVILEQVDRIQQVVLRFLNMARGGLPSLALTNPSEIAQSASALVEHRLTRASVSMTKDVPPTMPSILCDRGLLEQAVANLLLNACDACQPGGHVHLAARFDSERVAFVVSDDGTGIAAEDAARVSEPFFTTKKDGSSHGLGLAIVTEIAKSHRGELNIGPNSPRGTRACIEIPLAERESVHA